jgi:hypothetical protein
MEKRAQTDQENKSAQNYRRAIGVPHFHQVYAILSACGTQKINGTDSPATAVPNWRRFPASILMEASLARCQSDCAQEFHPARDALEMGGLLLKPVPRDAKFWRGITITC